MGPEPGDEESAPSTSGPADGFTTAIIEPISDPAYLQRQTEPNIERTYAYLHGNQDEFELIVNLVPVKEGIVTSIESRVMNQSGTSILVEITESPRITIADDVSVNASTLRAMEANESGYQAARQQVRDDVQRVVIDAFVESVYQNTTNDERLMLVIPDYQPTTYTESEKQTMVADRETEIRSAIRQQILAQHEAEINARVDNEFNEARDIQLPESAESFTGENPEIESAVIDLYTAFIDGFTTTQDYDGFTRNVESAKANLSVAVGARFDQELNANLNDQETLGEEELDSEAVDGLEMLQTGVGVLDLASIILPLIILLECGLLWYVTRSVSITLGGPGIALFVIGSVSYVSTGFVFDLIRTEIEQAALPLEIPVHVGLAFLSRILDTFAVQSIFITLLGITLLVIAGVIRFELVDFTELIPVTRQN